MTAGGDRIIRPSSLTEYPDCGRRWAARHLREEVLVAGYDLRPRPPSHVGALVGTGVHAGAALTLQHMREDGSLGSGDEAEAAAIEGFRERAAEEGASWDEITQTPNTAERQIRRMVRCYRDEVAPGIRPLLIEERLEADLAPGWAISGQADTLGEDVTTVGESIIRDTKTGTRRRQNAPQYGAYSMLLEAHGHRPTTIVEDYIRRAPVEKAQPPAEAHRIDVRTAREDAWTVLQAIQRDAAEWDRRLSDPNGADPRGAFLPNPASQLCSDRFCPAYGTRFCSSWKR